MASEFLFFDFRFSILRFSHAPWLFPARRALLGVDCLRHGLFSFFYHSLMYSFVVPPVIYRGKDVRIPVTMITTPIII